jgi:hypothetical protein
MVFFYLRTGAAVNHIRTRYHLQKKRSIGLNQQVNNLIFEIMGRIKDNTALIPFVLFGILAVIVGYSIYKGTKTTIAPASVEPVADNKNDLLR